MRGNPKLIGIIAVVVIIGAAGYLFFSKNSSKTPVVSKTASAASIKSKNTIRLIATGDMIPHDAINQEAKTGNTYNYYPMMQNMKPVFADSDINFCNMAVPAGGSQFGVTGYPVFNSPTEFIRDMDKVGCNLINTASNHTNDDGQKVIDAMVDSWATQPNLLAVVGANKSPADQQKISYFTIKGVKFAFLAYTTYSNTHDYTDYGVNIYSEALAKPQIETAKKNADIVIVSMRWGTEYSNTLNDTELQWSQEVSDWGADIVLGHGTHIVQPVKRLTSATDGHQTLVWYGLGNFLNAQEDDDNLFNGFAVMDIDTTSKKIKDIGFLPLYMHYEWTAQQKADEDLLARHNFSMYLLDDAAAPFAKSADTTTTSIAAQRNRLKTTLNTYTNVPMLSKAQYFAPTK